MESPELARLRSLIGQEQKSRWEAFGFSPEWSFELSALQVEGENAKKYLARFSSKGGKLEKEVFIKQYHHPEIGTQAVENEFQGLKITHERFQNDRSFGAPQPYGRVLEEKIIFMECCPALSFKEAIFKPLRFSRFVLAGRDRETLLAQMTGAGALLNAFQEIPASAHPADHQLTIEQILLRYERQLVSRAERCAGVGLPEKLLLRIKEHVAAGLKSVEKEGREGLRPFLQHTDFAPWNILVGKERLYLTDFQNFTTGFADYDAAFFHTAVGLLFRYRTLDLAFLAELRARFLKSYLKREKAPSALFKLFEISHMLYFAQSILSVHRPTLYEPVYAVPYRRFILEWFDRNLERRKSLSRN